MTDETDAELFIEAQDSVWEAVIAELTEGLKTSHWMWFVFPQLASLGQSDISQLYGLHDLPEAQAYLANETLRDRLVKVSSLMLTHGDLKAEQILGPVDALKLQSSMTLFSAVPDAPAVFDEVLDTFYGGKKCQETLRQLG